MLLKPLFLAVTLVFMAALSSHSNAALIYYTSSLPQSGATGVPLKFGNIAFPFNGSYTFGSTAGISFGIETAANGMFSRDNNGGIEWASGPLIFPSTLLYNGNVLKFSGGASISAGSASNWTSNDPGFAEDGKAGNWNAGGSGFAGLRFDGGSGNYYYGWVEMNYNAGADSVTVSRFAFQNVVNTAALTPTPEPAQVAASMLLLSGVAGYVFLQRRKKNLSLSKAG